MSRTYDQYCPVARALEFVGERWTLLVVRELMLGPRRFTDLMADLPGISTNVLAARLKDLEERGMVRRRTLPPPAGSTVYELTEESAGLAPVLVAMVRWGMSLLAAPRRNEAVPARSTVLALAVAASSQPDMADGTYELRLDDEVFQLRTVNGSIAPVQGPAADPDAVIVTRARTLAELAHGHGDLGTALDAGAVEITGDAPSARRVLAALTGAADPVAA